MPARLSKTMRHVLLKMAVNQSQGITVNFLLEPLTTRERKVMRQLIRGKLRSRNKYYAVLEREMYTFANENRAELRGNPYAIANTQAYIVEQILSIADEGEVDAKKGK